MKIRCMPWCVALMILGACLAGLQGPVAATGLSITPADATAMATNLIGPGITLISATYQGAAAASGTFSQGNYILPFNTGIVLTSGIASDLPGPNTNSGLTDPFQDYSYDHGLPGYAPLVPLGGGPSYDAAVLTIKFNPGAYTSASLIRYAFGSEEYKEFINTGWNDAFAFYLNGVNIALVPGTGDHIDIDGVNPNSNSAYYIDNPVPGGALNIKLDGFAGGLGALGLYATGPVIPYHENIMVIAISDIGDGEWDSAVFLKEGSFIGGPPPSLTPAPSSLLLLGSALLGLAVMGRRMKKF